MDNSLVKTCCLPDVLLSCSQDELLPSLLPSTTVGTLKLSATQQVWEYLFHIWSPDFPEGLSPQISKDRYLRLNCI